MKTYQLKDGGSIAAENPQEMVSKLRIGSKFDSECTNQEYMVNFSSRYKIQSGISIRSDNPENFVSDLIASGYME